jgi:hypothetical protein
MVTALANGAARNSNTIPSVPPPFPELAPPTPIQLRREYVAGGGWGWYGGRTARTLPNPIDDVTSEFGDDLYDRMMFDPQVAAVVSIFKASILETGPAITSVITDVKNPEYDKAKEITDQALRMLEDLEPSFDDALWNLLDCVAVGNKVAEKTYETARAIAGGRIVQNIAKLKVKPRKTTLFAVDTYLNVVGLLVAIPPNGEPVAGTQYFISGNQSYGLIPASKFVISRFRQKDSDPRGTSILRPAYAPWWRKQQIIPEYLKYLSQFAGPSLVGIAAPETQPIVDPSDPTKTISSTEHMLAALEQFRNMTAIAIPNGADVKPIVMQGDGAAFRLALGQEDQQITKAVLTQELATEEGKHMARAAAEVHQDVLDTLVRQGKLSVQSMIRRQVFQPWVALNWGEDFMHLAPIADLGATEQRDKPALWQGAAALMNSGYFTEDQMAVLDSMLGVPVRQTLTALAFRLADKPAAGATGSKPAEPPVPPDRVGVQSHTRQKPTRPQPGTPDKVPDKAALNEWEDSADDDQLQAA